MQFGTGVGGSVVSGLYGGGGSPASVGQAGRPAASSGPTGRPSLMAAAWGTNEDGTSRAGNIAGLVSVAAWVGLVFIWWTLPR